MSSDRENAHTLEILAAIEAKSDVTQRHLADRLGVALGLTNSYLKRCVRKGFVKITQAPANRYLYYVTPKGFKEKSRLTAEYLTSSLGFYRAASDSMAELIAHCNQHGVERIVLAGVSELAEIAAIRAIDHGVEILGTFDPASTRTSHVGLPVWKRLKHIPSAAQACVYSSLDADMALYNELHTLFSERLLVPAILRPIVFQQGGD